MKRRVYAFHLPNLRSYWTKVHQIYVKYSQIITGEFVKNQNGDIVIRFGMPGLIVMVNSPILSILPMKLVAMATSLESSKMGQIGNLRSNTYHVVKIW